MNKTNIINLINEITPKYQLTKEQTEELINKYQNDPRDITIIRKEIESYDNKLARKPELIIANKMDLPDAQENLTKFKKEYPNLPVVEVSAMNISGLDEMIRRYMYDQLRLSETRNKI